MKKLVTRSNYFRVRDVEAFDDWLVNYNSSACKIEKGDLVGFIYPNGPQEFVDKHGAIVGEDAVYMLQQLLFTTGVCVIQQLGHDNFNDLEAQCLVITSSDYWAVELEQIVLESLHKGFSGCIFDLDFSDVGEKMEKQNLVQFPGKKEERGDSMEKETVFELELYDVGKIQDAYDFFEKLYKYQLGYALLEYKEEIFDLCDIPDYDVEEAKLQIIFASDMQREIFYRNCCNLLLQAIAKRKDILDHLRSCKSYYASLYEICDDFSESIDILLEMMDRVETVGNEIVKRMEE